MEQYEYKHKALSHTLPVQVSVYFSVRNEIEWQTSSKLVTVGLVNEFVKQEKVNNCKLHDTYNKSQQIRKREYINQL